MSTVMPNTGEDLGIPKEHHLVDKAGAVSPWIPQQHLLGTVTEWYSGQYHA